LAWSLEGCVFFYLTILRSSHCERRRRRSIDGISRFVSCRGSQTN
jgi:hypothetical protein